MLEHDPHPTESQPHNDELGVSYVSPEEIIPESSLPDKSLMLIAVLALIALLYIGVQWSLSTAGSHPGELP